MTSSTLISEKRSKKIWAKSSAAITHDEHGNFQATSRTYSSRHRAFDDMAMRLRLRAPDGQHTLTLEPAQQTLSGLRQAVEAATQIAHSRQELLNGFPPAKV